VTKLWQTSPTLDAAVETYTVGDDPRLDAELLPYEALGSMAHALGLARIGLLTAREITRIRRSLRALVARGESFSIRRDQEDIHTAVEQHLTADLGETGAKIHAGRSRNDQVQVDLRMFFKDRLIRLHELAHAAAAAWAGFGRRETRTLLPGYTHLQRAMPTTLGHWAASHVEALLENARGLRFAFDEADACPLGSAAGYGAPLPLDRAYVARLLGFSRVQRNTLRVQTSRPRLDAVVLGALTVLARDLGVLAFDLSLYTTAEFGFLRLADAFTTGSSIMPQKKNPDVVELTRARAALFPGWLNQVLALGALPSGYHRDYQLGKGPLFAALDTMRAMLEIVARLPDSLAIQRDRCRAAITDDMLATHRALGLVRRGVPFRTAYRQIAEQARKAAPAAPAGAFELPDYPGAPGNPDWPAVRRDLAAAARWTTAERRKLNARWRKLL